MLKLSKKVEYALISLQYIAALPGNDVSTTREVADRFHIPPEILGKVLQALTRAEVIDSVQGAKGGYRLIRDLNKVNLGEVIEAVDGPVHVVPCTGDHYNCDQESVCNIKRPINHFESQLQQFVFGLTLDRLVKNAPWPDADYPPPEEQVTYVLFEEEE